MSLRFLIQGMLIGLSIAAPVGPIGVLCIRRSLADGPRIGLAVGLGAATADALYGAVAAFGLTAVSSLLLSYQFWLGLFGGLFLVYLGLKTFLSQPAEQAAQATGTSLGAVWFSTWLLTLTNPATILSFIAIFAGAGLGSAPDVRSAATIVLGVFLGSALWWLLLSSSVSLLRSRLDTHWLQRINRFSGCILLGFGVFALAHIFRH